MSYEELEEKVFLTLAASEKAQEQTAAQIEELKILRQEIMGELKNIIKTLPEACESQIRSAVFHQLKHERGLGGR